MSIQDDLPRSRINLKYVTNVDGIEQTLELPFRLLILGDFSAGTSVDRTVDLESRRLRSLDGKNQDSVMENMKMSLSFQVKNHIDPIRETVLDIKLPISSRRSFQPAAVAKATSQIRSLLLLRKLLLEMQSNIDNRKEVRRAVYEMYQNPEALQAVRETLGVYKSYRLPTGIDPNDPARAEAADREQLGAGDAKGGTEIKKIEPSKT